MQTNKRAALAALMLATCAAGAREAGATTLVRAGIADLTAANRLVVVGEVVDARSYWNPGHTFILTDVRVAPSEVLKGTHAGGDVTVTLMGGTVGDRTVMIVAGARLVPGRTYVMFLNDEDLPGTPAARTVRDHSQGVFELVTTAGGETRAVSQASDHPLAADGAGLREAPGGRGGLPLGELVRQVKTARGGAR